MLEPLLFILLVCSIALVALGVLALLVALPGLRRWARRSGDPLALQVSMPLALPPAGEGPAVPAATMVLPHAEPKVIERAGRAAIDVRLESSREVVGVASSAGPVLAAQLVIENIGDAPAYEVSLQPLDEDDGRWFDGLSPECRAAAQRPVPALGPGRSIRLKAGLRETVVGALGDDLSSARAMIGVAYAASEQERDNQDFRRTPVRVGTHGLELCAVTTPPAAAVSATARSVRNPFKPAPRQ
jgi:hypothetical protein